MEQQTVGKSIFSDYNDLDDYGPSFIKSLSFTFERGTPNTVTFMTKAGMCMGKCPQPELDLYTDNYPIKLTWYNSHKGDTPPPRPVTTTTTTTTTTVAPTTTTPAPEPSPTFISDYFPFFPDGPCVSTCCFVSNSCVCCRQ